MLETIVKLGNNYASEVRNHKITIHCFEKIESVFQSFYPITVVIIDLDR